MITYIHATDWIKASVKKPKDGEEVLGLVGKSQFHEIVVWSERDHAWLSADGMSKVHVTWWTQLPRKPYQDPYRMPKRVVAL